MTDLLNEVIAEQKRLGMNDSQFATFLGVNRSTWSRIKRGQRKISLGFIRCLMSKLPGLETVVLDHMYELIQQRQRQVGSNE